MFLITPRRERIPATPTPSDMNQLKTTLNELADFCAGSPVPILVTGGLSIALRLGGIYRNHHDVDLAVFEDHLPDFLRHIDTKGYRLVRAVASGHITPGHDLHIVEDATPETATKVGVRHLRVIPKHRRITWRSRRLTDCLDLFIYRQQDDGVYLLQEGFSIPHHEFFPIVDYDLSGKKLSTPNTRFIQRLKNQRTKTPTSLLDLSILSHGVDRTRMIRFEW